MAAGKGNGRGVRKRTLIIIGGHEDKNGHQEILRRVAACVGNKLVLAALASSKPEDALDHYERDFRRLGVRHIAKLTLETRADALHGRAAETFNGATSLFFTGGDPIKIVSLIGDTPVLRALHDLYHNGGMIAGTSAGAIAMCQHMILAGNNDASHRIGDLLSMAPGLGLIDNVIIDPHFSERGRMGRLLGAIAQNPRVLGIGIDEDTAIMVRNEKRFEVIGDGAVYIVDGQGITYSNIGEANEGETLMLHNALVHVLSHDGAYDLQKRLPLPPAEHDRHAPRSGPPGQPSPQDSSHNKSAL